VRTRLPIVALLVAVAAIAVVTALARGGGDGASHGVAPPSGRPAALRPLEPWSPPAVRERRAGVSIADVLSGAGGEAAMLFGQPNFLTGDTRLAFAVVRADGKLLTAQQADVYVSRSRDGEAMGPYRVRLLPIQPPGGAHGHDDVGHFDPDGVLVGRVPLDRPGTWYLAAVMHAGGRRVVAEGALRTVRSRAEPVAGDAAPRSDTPTVRSTGGDLAKLTTARPADTPLLRVSVRDALAAHRPFVVMFATPAFCTSRLCGPATDVLLALERRYRATKMAFIHVEIYRDNRPPTPNRWVEQWRLTTEPFSFVVGADGKVLGSLEGPQTPNELAAMIERAAPAAAAG
jgi:hypothetical protein